jgi:hypothetical protein
MPERRSSSPGREREAGCFRDPIPFPVQPDWDFSLQISRVRPGGGGGSALVVSGIDLVDGTVGLDVKPYLLCVDLIPGAWSGVATEVPERLPVRVSEEASGTVSKISEEQREVIPETLNLDARPASHEKQERTCFLRIFDLDVAWKVKNSECVLCGFRNLRDRTQ